MTEYQQHFSMCVHLHVVPLIFFFSSFFFSFLFFFLLLSLCFSLFMGCECYIILLWAIFLFILSHTHITIITTICGDYIEFAIGYYVCSYHILVKIVILHFKTLILCIYYSFVYDLWFEHSLVTIFLDIKS